MLVWVIYFVSPVSPTPDCITRKFREFISGNSSSLRISFRQTHDTKRPRVGKAMDSLRHNETTVKSTVYRRTTRRRTPISYHASVGLRNSFVHLRSNVYCEDYMLQFLSVDSTCLFVYQDANGFRGGAHTGSIVQHHHVQGCAHDIRSVPESVCVDGWIQLDLGIVSLGDIYLCPLYPLHQIA